MANGIPVLLIIFNRPSKTAKVMASLREARVSRLFVAADGPRAGNGGDVEKCHMARQLVRNVDWPCMLDTKFSDTNLGCDPCVSSAISWFFEHVEYGVILEDDCVPHPTFFQFCSELFIRFAEDNRIMQVSGFSPSPRRPCDYDYHFSRTFACWGWGTWRRAWKHFSYDMSAISEDDFGEIMKAYYPTSFLRAPWLRYFEMAKRGEYAPWDLPWNVACFAQNGLCIVPECSLVKNIGFDEESTHTVEKVPLFEDTEAQPIALPLRHPPFVYADGRPQRSTQRLIHRSLPFKTRCGQQLRHALGALGDFLETRP